MIAAGVFNSGILAGGTTFNYQPAPPELLARAAAVFEECSRRGVSPAAAALQFPLTHPAVKRVLAGARSDRRESDLRRLLARFELLPFDVVADFDGATRLYRRCRRAGVTPRGMVDCMIVAVALRRGATLLSHDADMDRLAEVTGIALDEASLRTT